MQNAEEKLNKKCQTFIVEENNLLCLEILCHLTEKYKPMNNERLTLNTY